MSEEHPEPRGAGERVGDVYHDDMRRIQLFMDEALDDQLEREAAATGTSKAAIVRQCVARRYAGERTDVDPLGKLIGAFDGPATDDIDEAIYG